MAHFAGPSGARFGEIVQAVNGTSSFDVTSANVIGGKLPFSGTLVDGDSISYAAYAADDPSVFEVGHMTYVAATKTFTRSDAGVKISSNSGSRVNFLSSVNGRRSVILIGRDQYVSFAYTLTNTGATRTINGAETDPATIAAALTLLISDLAAAGVLST